MAFFIKSSKELSLRETSGKISRTFLDLIQCRKIGLKLRTGVIIPMIIRFYIPRTQALVSIIISNLLPLLFSSFLLYISERTKKNFILTLSGLLKKHKSHRQKKSLKSKNSRERKKKSQNKTLTI